MLVLALDTALDRTAVAITDGGRLAVSHAVTMDRGHAERLFGMIEDVRAEAGVAIAAIDRIAVTVGPGSFTGIRIALAAARGLGLATGCPVVGVGTLEALAASAPEPSEGPVLAAIDARRGELYAALFAPDGSVIDAPFAASAETVLARCGPRARMIVGSGAPLLTHAAAVAGRSVPPAFALAGPDPLVVARIGARAVPADRPPAPLYIRAPDAKPQAAQAEFAT